MKYASAGHNPPPLIDYGTGSIQHLKTKKGFPLMINSHNEIEELETPLSPNSKLICYTDGFTEARGKGTDMYGLNRLGQKSLELGKSRNADELGRALKQDAQDFLDGGDFRRLHPSDCRSRGLTKAGKPPPGSRGHLVVVV